MRTPQRNTVLSRLGMLVLLALACPARVIAADAPAPALPPGWQPLAATASLPGSFLHPGSKEVAVLAHNDDRYGLAIVPDRASGRQASIVSTFQYSPANPPQLSLVQPGSYPPVCHNGGACTPIRIDTEAVGLCFGEASCEIIYFNGNTFDHITITD